MKYEFFFEDEGTYRVMATTIDEAWEKLAKYLKYSVDDCKRIFRHIEMETIY